MPGSLVFTNRIGTSIGTSPLLLSTTARLKQIHVAFLRHSTSSQDVDYDNIAVESVKVRINDDDENSLIIGKAPLMMDVAPDLLVEEGETDSYYVALPKQPAKNVEVLLFSYDGHCSLDGTSEYGLFCRDNQDCRRYCEGKNCWSTALCVRNTKAIVAPKSIIFSPNSWNIPVQVNVTALKDSLKEPDVHRAKLLHVVADTSGGGEQILYADIIDGDQSGVLVVPSEARVLEGNMFSYHVQLYSQPTDDVTVEISSSSQLSLSAESLTFTPETWAAPQLVTVTSLEDSIDFGRVFETLVVHYAVSNDRNFDKTDFIMSVSVTDNDFTGLLFTDSSLVRSLTAADGAGGSIFDLAELGESGKKTYGVSLGSVLTKGYCLQSINGGVDKSRPCVEDASCYKPLAVSRNSQNEAGWKGACEYMARPQHPEGGQVSPFATILSLQADSGFCVVGFNRIPRFDQLCSKDIDCGHLNHCEKSTKVSVGVQEIVFTLENWNIPQVIDVYAFIDMIDEPNPNKAAVVHTVHSPDDRYHMFGQELSVRISDSNEANVRIGALKRIFQEDEAETVSVKLDTKPLSRVRIIFTSSVPYVELSPAVLDFHPENWDKDQLLTVRALRNAVAAPDGAAYHSASIFVEIVTTDVAYDKVSIDDMEIAIVDDDSAGIALSSGLIKVVEGSVDVAFTVVLTSKPREDVVVTVVSFGGYCVSPSDGRKLGTTCRYFSDCGFTAVCEQGMLMETDVSEVIFGPEDWNVPKIIAVHAFDDSVVEGADPIRTQILLSSISADHNYNGRMESLAVDVVDNDAADFVLSQARRLGVSDMVYTVHLSSMPLGKTVSVDIFNGSRANFRLLSSTGTCHNKLPLPLTMARSASWWYIRLRTHQNRWKWY